MGLSLELPGFNGSPANAPFTNLQTYQEDRVNITAAPKQAGRSPVRDETRDRVNL
jgi:hypothetical protein